MKCRQCRVQDIAGKCPVTHTLVCGKECQIDAYLAFIEGKRKPEDEDTQCLNDTDPITLDDISKYNPNEVIKLGQYCFYLPALYRWIMTDHNKNPFTNKILTTDDINYIKRLADERFFMEFPVVLSDGRMHHRYTGNTLDYISDMIIRLYRGQFDQNIDSLRKCFVLDSRRPRGYYLFHVVDHKPMTIVELLTKYQNVSIRDASLKIIRLEFFIHDMTERDMLYRVNGYIAYVIYVELKPFTPDDPLWVIRTHYIDLLKKRAIDQILSENAQNYFKQVRALRNYTPKQFPNSYKINILLDTPSGRDYGIFHIFVHRGNTMESILPLVVDELRDVVRDLPEVLQIHTETGKNINLTDVIDTYAEGTTTLLLKVVKQQ